MEIENKRRFRYGSQALLLTLGVVALCLLLYGILDRRAWRVDLTHNREFSLAEQTTQILKNLQKPVVITAFFRHGSDPDSVFIRRKVDDVLNEYAARSSKITYQMVDPDLQIQMAVDYQVNTDGTVFFQSGNNKKTIYPSELFDYSKMHEQSLPDFVGESLFTNALLRVTKDGKKKACFLEGHGERKLDDPSPNGWSGIKSQLEAANYDIASHTLSLSPKIPNDCTLIILAGPEKPLLTAEENLLMSWIENGQPMFLLVEPGKTIPVPKIFNFLNLESPTDLVLDPGRHFLLGPHFPSPLPEEHAITKSLKNSHIVFGTARRLTIQKEENDDLTTSSILKTSPEGGSHSLAVAIQKGEKPLVVVVGDADFASNSLLQAPSNLDLFLNITNWLSGDSDEIAIRPKTSEFRGLTLSAGKAKLVAIFTQIIWPLTILALGGVYWFRRRRS